MQPTFASDTNHTHTQVDDWEFDVFQLTEATAGRPLSTLAFALFSRSNLLPRFNISDVKLARYVFLHSI